ncbi:MAG: glycosyltransferase family 4 protein [Tannerellaceae bacterium]|nr:glycosyltransferase family 4 protein [Tannerellaceae bacterium]
MPQKKENVFFRRLIEDEKLVKKIRKLIPVESTRLVVSQNLLPFLHQEFITAGRTYDVLMNQTPIRQLQNELDIAYKKYSKSPTLNDFRAADSLILLEEKGLEKARKIITPHTHIASLYKNVIKLDWIIERKSPVGKGFNIVFPGSMLARKGGYEIKRLAKELNLTITITGKATEKAGFLNDITFQWAEKNYLETTRLIIYPVYIESHPKQLIKAIEAGIPIITTEACGLSECENVTIVPTGNYEQLRNAVIKQLALSNKI